MRIKRAVKSLAVLAAMMFAVSGCVKMKWLVIVYPDGSGKMEITAGMNSAIAEMGKMGGEDVEMPQVGDTDAMAENSKGFVAWSRPTESKEGDFTLYTTTGYFKDINQVEFTDEEGGKPTKFTFEKADDGTYKFTFVEEGSADDIKEQSGEMGGGADDEMGKEMAKAMMKSMMAGMEVSYGVRMPGDVTEAEEMNIEGRQAVLKIDVDKLVDLMSKPKEEIKDFQGTIKCQAEADLAEEMAAFQKEMEAAIAEWPKIQEEMKAKEKEEATPEKEEGEEGEHEKEEGGDEEV